MGVLNLQLNREVPPSATPPTTISDLIAHYKQAELSLERSQSEETDEYEKAYSTKKAYRIFLDRWIEPRWGRYRIDEIRTIAVEQWLRGLTLDQGRRMARGTKAKIRNIFHSIFNHAIRWQWLPQNANPISKVRQSSKRERVPEILDAVEIQALLSQLSLRDRMVVALAATTGLRRGELFGLKWSDVDFEKHQISVTRSIVQQVVGRCKTEASQKPVPLYPGLAEDLKVWKQTTEYGRPADWIFASARKNGRQPLWPDTLLSQVILPAAKRAGITKNLGFHTFRRSFATLLKANGEDVKVVQELMRHANSKITLDTYAQALSPAKRQAQIKLAELILPRRTI